MTPYSHTRSPRQWAHATAILVATFMLSAAADQSSAATIRECQEFLRVGEYEKCRVAAAEAIERRSYGEEWPILKSEAETKLGQYTEAIVSVTAGVARYSWSIRLRMRWHDLCRITGDAAQAKVLIEEVNQLAVATPWRYTDADDLVALGHAALVMGADPKDVLEGFFNRARENYQTRPDGFLAAGRLAVDKEDFALAAEILRPAQQKFDDNPDLTFALAEALMSSSAEEAAKLIEQTLLINPHYAPALLHIAERHVDAESYDDALSSIAAIHEFNAAHPKSHALAAVIHHLNAREDEEKKSRDRALQTSSNNPEIDHYIGERLSRKYRFREGAAYQRQALAVNPDYLPAKVQLAQDLLRLGEDASGWKLAAEARKEDKYSTMLFNLMQLKDSLDTFETWSNERFIIRMTKREAIVYGPRVEQLLNTAWDQLTETYGYTPTEPVVVEIFDRPDDFAVRTFGIPDVAGFLGVCFGKLITANSPASMRQNPNNWESVLWHEFCHVITLQMTGNRIPRWLSEGISVYEERQKDPRWGQSMSPDSRRRILDGDVTPVSELSSAFLKATSGGDLNFAYYESSMVVEFLVQEHGLEALIAVLKDLNSGLNINDALDRHTNGIEALNAEFSEWLTDQAKAYAPGVVFDQPRDPESPQPIIPIDTVGNSVSYSAELRKARRLVRDGNTDAAVTTLQELIKRYPQDASPGGSRVMLASIFEKLNDTDRQQKVLTEHLQRCAEDFVSTRKLMSLKIQKQDWKDALTTANLAMAIDPLQPALIRDLLTIATATDDRSVQRLCLNGLLELEPGDAARTHFLLAQLHRTTDVEKSRRHVLLALERAPRYREAHRLLLELTEESTEPAAIESEAEGDPSASD